MDNRADLINEDPRAEIVDLVANELSAIRRQLSEIKAQIEQTQQLVDREQQRNSDLATELRNIQDNLDTVPRQDIRDKYEEALDARFRLATMRGQLEKFESNYDRLENTQQILAQVLSALQGVDMLEAGGEEIDTGSRQSSNIIRIVQAQEDERRKLARQIHDGPAQSLTNFILQAEICQRLFDRDPDRAAEELQNLKTAASVTFQKVRDFIFDLRPMMLDDLGVASTVRTYAKSFQQKNDIEVSEDIAGEDRRLETHREVLIFRSIQELMVQARDYASPAHIDIKLDLTSDPIRIVVEDDGRGFDPTPIFEAEEGAHLDGRGEALLTLKEKMELIGGKIAIESSEAEGTTVRLEIPAGE